MNGQVAKSASCSTVKVRWELSLVPSITPRPIVSLNLTEELRKARVRIEGSADPALVRVLLECLRA